MTNRQLRCSWILILVLMPICAAEQPSLEGIPAPLTWQNEPVAWQVQHGTLTLRSGKESDWFVDPFDNTIHKSAPILLFQPADDYILTAKVRVTFTTKWDAGALMVWADDHHWAKLSYELSPDKKPTMVTVVTRGVSDDCNSMTIPGNEIYLQIAKSGPAYVFYASTDGKDWQVLRVFSLGDTRKPRVGFESQSPAGSGTEAIFSEIHYVQRKIADIYNYDGKTL